MSYGDDVSSGVAAHTQIAADAIVGAQARSAFNSCDYYRFKRNNARAAVPMPVAATASVGLDDIRENYIPNEYRVSHAMAAKPINELVWSQKQLQFVARKFKVDFNTLIMDGELDAYCPKGIDKITWTSDPKDSRVKTNLETYANFYKSLDANHIENLRLYFRVENKEWFIQCMKTIEDFDAYQQSHPINSDLTFTKKPRD